MSTTPDKLATGQWYFFAATHDGVSAWRLYVWDDTASAVLVNKTLTQAFVGDCTDNPFVVGSHPDSIGTECFDGLLDEITVWNRALTETEIELIRDGLYDSRFVVNFLGESSMDVDLEVVNFAPIVGQWTFPVRERLGFYTEVLQPHDRVTEQRIAHRCDGSGNAVPTQQLTTEIIVKGDDNCARFETILHRWLKMSWPVPQWGQAELHTPALASGSSSIAVDTQYADFRAQSWAMIWQSDSAYEIVKTSAVAAGALTLTDATVKAYAGNKWIVPCRLGWIIDAAKVKRFHGGALYEITWEVDTSDLSAVTGYVADLTYDSLTVLVDPAYWPGDHGQAEHNPDVAVLGGETGPFEIISNSDFNDVMQSHVWHPTGKQACWELRQFLYSVKGRQKAFLVPTFRKDLTLTRPCGAADTSVYVGNKGFATYMGLNALRTYLAFRPANANPIVRKITGMSVLNDSEEKIDLASAPGAAFIAGANLCWVDKCRLASDDVTLNWRKRGSLECSANLVRVT